MTQASLARPIARRTGAAYAFVVGAVIFLALLVAAGLRGAPAVLLQPLERAFGWSRADTSLAAAVGLLLYGMMGPFAAALMQRFGVRRVLLSALLIMSLSTAASLLMREHWQLVLTWGVLSGVGSGCVTVVLGATIVNRWFTRQRGLMMGLLTASTATGTLLFIPLLARLAALSGWQAVVAAVSGACLLVIPLAALLLPESPAELGLAPYGSDERHVQAPASAPLRNPFASAVDVLAGALGRRDFWLLFATFFICGATTNGLVGTHLIALCGDNGIPEVSAAGMLATMGIFDLIGTTLSGWLTDRYDARKLLFVYYGLRGLSLIWLPHSDFSLYSLSLFSVFYGLDWIATVPPTLRLTNAAFGDAQGPVVFAWVVAGHQVGAATAAMTAGALRSSQGNYIQAFTAAGITGLFAALIALTIRRPGPAHATPLDRT